jgi:hypothetical protein
MRDSCYRDDLTVIFIYVNMSSYWQYYKMKGIINRLINWFDSQYSEK